MKKRFMALLALPLVMAIASCQNTNGGSSLSSEPSSNDTSSIPDTGDTSSSISDRSDTSSTPIPDSSISSSSSSSIAVDEDLANQASQIYQYLVRAASSRNYSLKYVLDGVEVTDYWTTEYMKVNWAKGGYLALESYDSSIAEKLYYNYRYDDEGNVVVGQALSDPYVNDDVAPAIANETNFDYINPLYKIVNPNNGVGSSAITYDSTSVYTDNYYIMVALGSVLGFTSNAIMNYYPRADLTLSENGDISFALYIWEDPEDDSNENIVLFEEGVGTITAVNSTHDASLAGYVDSFVLPTNSLEGDKGEVLTANTLTSITSINITSGSGSRRNYMNIAQSISSEYRALSNETLYSNGDIIRSSEFISHNIDMSINEHYIDGDNKVVVEAQSYKWNFANVPEPQKIISPKAFRSNEANGFYKYYGPNPTAVLDSLSKEGIIFMGSYASFGATVENGKLVNINGSSYHDETFDNTYSFVSTLSVGEELTTLKPYEVDTTDSSYQNFSAALSKLNNQSQPFKLVLTDPTNNIGGFEVYRTSEAILFLDNTSYLPSGYGYKVTDEGLLKFNVDYDYIDYSLKGIKAEGKPDPSKTLADCFNLNIKPELVYLTDHGDYALKPFVKGVGESTLGDDSFKDLSAGSLSLTVNSNNFLTGFSYTFSGESYGDRDASITYDNVTLPSGIDISSLVFIDYDTWYTQGSFISHSLERGIGLERANLLPYLNEECVNGKWSSMGYPNVNGGFNNYFFIDETETLTSEANTYFDRYKALLLECGYVVTTRDGKERYENDLISVYFDPSGPRGGIGINALGEVTDN